MPYSNSMRECEIDFSLLCSAESTDAYATRSSRFLHHAFDA